MWASDSEHRIKTFTELWQIGINDSTLSETDFFANIQLIAETMPVYSRLVFYCRDIMNFTKSLYVQLSIDKAVSPEDISLFGREGTITIEKNANLALGVPVEYKLNYWATRLIGRYDVNSGNKVWYPFRTVAVANDYPIRSYSSTLEHFGLSDEEMSPDNFAENFNIIANAMKYNYGFFAFLYCTNDTCPNLLSSIIKKLEANGIDYGIEALKPTITMLISRCGGIKANSKIELTIANSKSVHGNENLRDLTIVSCANYYGSTMYVQPFRETATTDYGVITPLNGWVSPGSTPVAVRSGRYVDINFGFENGVATHGTVIGKVPEGFRPCETRTIPVLADAHAENARLVVYTNGDIKLFGANEATKKIVGTGGYMI